MAGCMSGQTQAKAWALREAWRDEHGDATCGMLTHTASKLYVISPPKEKKEHPTPSALAQLFQKIDSDKEGWFPGKNDQKKRGPDSCDQWNQSECYCAQCDDPQGKW